MFVVKAVANNVFGSDKTRVSITTQFKTVSVTETKKLSADIGISSLGPAGLVYGISFTYLAN